MKLVFNINYHTVWGESLYLCGDLPELGSGDPHKALEMKLTSPDMWQLTLDLDSDPSDFNYWFVVKSPDKAWRFEWGKPHRYVAGSGIRSVLIFDSWHEQPHDKPFYSSAFTEGIFHRSHRDQPLKALPGTINIRVEAPMLNPDEVLAVTGEGDLLGNWDPKQAIRLNDEGIDCPLAIETSGHAALRENYFLDDGMYLVTRLICEALRRKREGETLSSLIDELQEPVESVELRLPILDQEDFRAAGQEVIEAILSHTLDNPEWQLAPDNREGVRISFNLDGGVNNAWFLLRLSVHDPVMPLNAESDVPGGVKRMLGELCALLEGVETLDLGPLKAAIGK